MRQFSINPVIGKKIKKYKTHSLKQVRQKIEQTHTAWLKWKDINCEERGVFLNNMANVLNERKIEFANLMALEMGKPVTQGITEIEKCASVCAYYAKNAGSYLKDQAIKTEAVKSYVSYQPIGIVLAIMPWNFPFWQVFRFLAPALAAGNCGILKHAANVPGCALAIEEIVKQAGLPENVFQTLLVNSDKVEKIIENKYI